MNSSSTTPAGSTKRLWNSGIACPFSNDLPRTALRLQTGVEGQVLKNVTINAHIGMEKSFDGSGLTSLNGQVGLKVAFCNDKYLPDMWLDMNNGIPPR
ncbi:autotransporter outer membrane beta-barrel domain-containing protein [Pseudomonas chlororaphis]|uniref:autotransporter outer membrane beta-barrel domain-containing protein n=1 Tax=Pseudomonas chlororaphis TaxID=587753 RepID=UPI00139243C3|nr:autotransporter outer membrane beta-barrel domain-containing protein [Pseudomonas chlororaphis]